MVGWVREQIQFYSRKLILQLRAVILQDDIFWLHRDGTDIRQVLGSLGKTRAADYCQFPYQV